MIVLASVVAIGASMNAWLNRQVLDTDNWVEASDQVLEEPAVRAALSTYLVNELFSYVDVSAQLEDRLPDSLSVLAGPDLSSVARAGDRRCRPLARRTEGAGSMVAGEPRRP